MFTNPLLTCAIIAAVTSAVILISSSNLIGVKFKKHGVWVSLLYLGISTFTSIAAAFLGLSLVIASALAALGGGNAHGLNSFLNGMWTSVCVGAVLINYFVLGALNKFMPASLELKSKWSALVASLLVVAAQSVPLFYMVVNDALSNHSGSVP